MGMDSSKQAAKKFREYWTFNRPGSERSGCQQYWNMLLGELLGQTELERVIRYEVPVQLKGSTKYLDAWIPSTRVLIEHKSRGVKLDAPQPGHDNMTPFEQAKFYDDHRAFDEKARWIVTCNFDEIWIYDQTKPLDPPEKIALATLPKEVHRLSFLVNAAVKKVDRRELEISVQAGKIVGTLYDALLKQYAEPDSPETLKALNKLCVRLVFCFYAEDADIFDKNLFRKLVSATPVANLRRALLTLFDTLDTPIEDRDKYLEPEFAAFPYTNGGLFKGATEMEIPPLTEEIRNLLIGSSDFDWSGIDTTIFGALFESTLNPETRRAGGMVYTSSENIHKLIDPLFLDDLEAQYDEIVSPSPDGRARTPAAPRSQKERTKQLLALQDHIASLTFLDPACGSGNFLTETYTSLRRLENKIITTLQDGQSELDLGLRVKVSIDQFHGIEINDFAVTVAQTAMWISEAKMLRETADILHRSPDFLPLKSYNGIVEGNALRMDWSTLLHRTGCVPEARFNYIIGNPPFVGARNKSPEQANDVESVFPEWKNAGNLDYVTCWYKKAADYMIAYGRTTHAAFVSTNSICQGDGVAPLWKPLFEQGVEIDYAWRTFRWDNESFEKAHVHVVIVGFHCVDSAAKGTQGGRKVIYDGDKSIEAKHINAYLTDAADVFVESRSRPLCDILEIGIGSQPIDDGNYLFTQEEKDAFLKTEPAAEKHIHPWLGSQEFLNNIKRYCLWLGDCSPAELRAMPQCMARVKAVRDFRLASKRASTLKSAETPTRFAAENIPNESFVLVPKVSSERRKYVPMGFVGPDTFCSDLVFLIPKATLYHFGVLTSSVHMAWMRTVCGRLEMRYRYSAAIVYNNFPWPDAARPESAPYQSGASDGRANTPGSPQSEIEKTAQGILDARALYPDSSLADLYDPLTMPPELRKAHAANDAAVLKAYGWPTDLSEPEIVSRLFDMYAKMAK